MRFAVAAACLLHAVVAFHSLPTRSKVTAATPTAFRPPFSVVSSISANDSMVCNISDDEAYHDVVESTRSKGRVAVIKFSSQRCGACKGLHPQLEKMAKRWQSVDFFDLNFESKTNSKVFKLYGIRRLPYMHIVSGGRVVDSFVCPMHQPHLIRRKLQSHGCQPTKMGPLSWLTRRIAHRWRPGRHSRWSAS